ncbi:CRISPR-associated protein Cas4 [Embleya sp. AB8]|uniref:CRISPR-associated protein Cas4 n=1 Tax=Embleya sp. AB8 TaxID=3156304 RepID=UPI003C738BF7
MTAPNLPASPAPEPTQVPISALEHYTYCGRQAGLILLEDAFADDAATVRGTILHERVHTPGHETRPGTKTLRALPVWHDDLGLTGVCDVVEIRRKAVTPVEHKSGRYQPGGPADVQVAAQAMCLEAMFGVDIDKAVIWSAADRRRHEVAVDATLRTTVETTTAAVRTMLAEASLPAAPADKRCRRCSMAESCMPKVLAGDRRYRQALADLYRIPTDEPPTPT